MLVIYRLAIRFWRATFSSLTLPSLSSKHDLQGNGQQNASSGKRVSEWASRAACHNPFSAYLAVSKKSRSCLLSWVKRSAREGHDHNCNTPYNIYIYNMYIVHGIWCDMQCMLIWNTSKIMFLESSLVLRYIHPDQLPIEYGGTNSFDGRGKWDHENSVRFLTFPDS